MSCQIIRTINIFLETAGMLYRHVNGFSLFDFLEYEKRTRNAEIPESIRRRTTALQAILNQVCRDLDPQDPALRYYFGNHALEETDICLAFYLTNQLIGSDASGEAAVELMLRFWNQGIDRGWCLDPVHTNGLHFREPTKDDGDLFDQIRKMKLPPSLQMDMYSALRNFEGTIRDLSALMEPTARKLEQALAEQSWILEESIAHWEEQLTRITPAQFLASAIGQGNQVDPQTPTVVQIQLMNSNILVIREADPDAGQPAHVFSLGCCVSADTILRRRQRDEAYVCSVMKFLGDPRRVEVLRRLNLEKGYGGDLAEVMGMDPSNMYRILTQLHNFGLLDQERGHWRSYYRTNEKAFRSFLKLLEHTVLGTN